MKSMYFLLRELGNLSLDFHDPLLPLLFPRILKRLHDVAHVDALQRGGVDADLEQDLIFLFAGVNGCFGSITAGGQFAIFPSQTRDKGIMNEMMNVKRKRAGPYLMTFVTSSTVFGRAGMKVAMAPATVPMYSAQKYASP